MGLASPDTLPPPRLDDGRQFVTKRTVLWPYMLMGLLAANLLLVWLWAQQELTITAIPQAPEPQVKTALSIPAVETPIGIPLGPVDATPDDNSLPPSVFVAEEQGVIDIPKPINDLPAFIEIKQSFSPPRAVEKKPIATEAITVDSDVNAALQAADHAAQLHPDNMMLKQNLAALLDQAGQSAAALTYYDAIIAADATQLSGIDKKIVQQRADFLRRKLAVEPPP